MADIELMKRGYWVRLAKVPSYCGVVGSRALAPWLLDMAHPEVGAIGKVVRVEEAVGDEPAAAMVRFRPPWACATIPQLIDVAELESFPDFGNPIEVAWWISA